MSPPSRQATLMPQTYPSRHGQAEPRSARRPSSLRLGVDRDDANAAQIGQLSRDLPIMHRAVSYIEIRRRGLEPVGWPCYIEPFSVPYSTYLN